MSTLQAQFTPMVELPDVLTCGDVGATITASTPPEPVTLTPLVEFNGTPVT